MFEVAEYWAFERYESQLCQDLGYSPAEQMRTQAVEAIQRVGPNGHYLKDEHTRRYYKTEFWYPNLCDRNSYEDWDMMGRLTMKDRTIERVRDILATHEASPIKPETEKVIQQVLAEAEERVKDKA